MTNQKNTQPFVIERTFNAPIKKVWRAISDKNEMKKWYFDLPEFKAETGCEFTFSAGSPDKKYVHLCRVTEVIPEKKISYTWQYEGYEGMSLVTFELFEENGQTQLKLTHAGLESFPKHPDFAKESFEKGWSQIIGHNLPKFVEDNS